MIVQFEKDGINFEILKEYQRRLNMKEDHYHDSYEIYFYLGDYMEYFIDNRAYPLHKYDLILIDRLTFHRTLYPEKSLKDRLLVLYNPEVIATLDDEIRCGALNLFKMKKPVLRDDQSKSILRIEMNRLQDACQNTGTAAGREKFKIQLTELLLMLIDMAENNKLTEMKQTSASPQEESVAEIITYINAHYESTLSLDEMAHIFKLSKYYMCHIFKEATGFGIIEFGNRKKLAEAECLLKYSSQTVTDICYNLGFNNISHFISLFKRQYGYTPGAYRNQFTALR